MGNEKRRGGCVVKTRMFALLFTALLFLSAALADGAGGGYATGDYLGSSAHRAEAVVISKNVSIRKEKSTGSSKLGSATNGEVLTVLDDGDERWVYVRAGQKSGAVEGYVQRQYIVVQPLSLILRRGNMPAYAAPTRSAKLVGSLDTYTKLEVVGTYGDFYIVNLRQASAFIPMDAEVWTSREIELLFESGSGTAVTIRRTTPHTGPDASWAKGADIPKGETLTIGWPEDGWVPALYKDKLVYLPQDDLEVTRRVSHPAASTGVSNPTGTRAGQTITLPRADGVTLTFWAIPIDDGIPPFSGVLSLNHATEMAVREIIQRYGQRRRDLRNFEIHYAYYTSAYYAYGIRDPFWTIRFWDEDRGGEVWNVDVNARNGTVLSSAGPDEGNG